ncbi:MAG: cell wall hydrolase [Peptococcaceae bacterium BICA1-7]|nr:MAG: cell wall hydrolase [Peptococcaceae bacterium BICA1-7]HBV96767.1 LysM peptidoglycan-binding domain-containing protein [Desulfotomaculum sp.]
MSTSFTRAASVIGLLSVLLICVMGAASGEEKVESTGQTTDIVYYTVQEGDTLSEIADSTGSHVETILKANRISNTVIHPGQVLLIPGREPDYEMALSRGFSREDVLLLSRAIHAEARGEPFAGQVAVGAVIVNRMKSGEFPRTVSGVVMQNRKGTYQFTPVQDGSINLSPDDTAIYAAIQAIAGQDPTSGALYFYNPETATDQWIKSLPVVVRIGNHVFAKRNK